MYGKCWLSHHYPKSTDRFGTTLNWTYQVITTLHSAAVYMQLVYWLDGLWSWQLCLMPHLMVPESWRTPLVVVRCSGSTLVSIHEVNLCWVWLVVQQVTISRFNSRHQILISECNQPPRSTQPGHPFVGRHTEYQPNGGDDLQLGSKGRYGSCMGGRWKCVIPLLYTQPYLNTPEIYIIKRYTNSPSFSPLTEHGNNNDVPSSSDERGDCGGLATLDDERSRSRASTDLGDTTSSLTPANALSPLSHNADTHSTKYAQFVQVFDTTTTTLH